MCAFRILQTQEEGSDDDFRLGEIVEVRCLSEIFKTLDENGTLEGLPFMQEMAEFCGKRFRVQRKVGRILVEGIGNRRIKNAVTLEGLRCDGEGHGGCKRTCVLLWKKAWLKRVQEYGSATFTDLETSSRSFPSDCFQAKNCACQLTQLSKAASRLPISFEDLVRQYLCEKELTSAAPYGRLCAFLLWLNFKVARSLGRKKYATLHGTLKKTPMVSMALQPGEMVEVKNREEILATLDTKGRNRGLSLTAEMLKYCGKRYRVLKRVDKMIVEKTGRLRKIPNTVILEGVTCDGSDHSNCPRTCYCLWREAWLKRAFEVN